MPTCLAFRTAFGTGVVALAVAWPLSAERLPVRIFTTADGLPRDQLQCVRSDKRGFVWFCTAEGLVRFDGQVAVTFGREDGLSPTGVRSFLNASGDRYFVGADEGLFAFDAGPLNGATRFTALGRDDRQRTHAVNALVESRDGTIWCGTSSGLLQVSQAAGRTHLVEVEIGLPPELESRVVHAVLEDERGILWVGAGSGLYAREPGGRVTRVTVAQGLPANAILNLALDAQGRLLAATREGVVLLDRLAILRRDRPAVRRVFTEREGLPARNVRSFHSEGRTLWIGTVFGLAEASLTEAGDLKVERTVTGFGAWGIAIDLRGNVWVATDAGARRLSRRGFVTYSTEDGLPTPRVSALFETSTGQVCASTLVAYRLEFSCLDGQRFRLLRPAATERIRDTGWGWSQLTLQDRREGWWIPTSQGLLRFAPAQVSSLSTARPASTFTRREGLRSDGIFRLFEDSRGGIWVATNAEEACGLARIDPDTGAARVFGPPDGFQDNLPLVHALAEDRFGAVWVGFNEGRLLRYRDRFEEIPLRGPQSGQGSPVRGTVRSILGDRRGRVWLTSTVYGLGRIDDPRAAVPAIRWYGKAEGLSSDTAWMLVEDLSGDLFVGTGRGVDRFNPDTDRFTHFSADDGVPRGEILGGLRDRSGRIWLATTAGVARFDARAEARHPQPVILITAIRIGGMPLPTRADGTPRFDGVTVQPGDRRVEIDFVSPGAQAADGLRYQHQLQGVDRDWTITDARTVAFAGAAPGSYRFLVRAVFANGTVTDPATVEFTVLAPFWQRRWFLALAAISTCLLAFVVHRSRVRRAIAVERVRSQIAADLHDGVGASLSRIAILSEVVRQQARSALPDAIPALTAISDNARMVIDDMSDAVWFIDPHVDNLHQVVTRARAMASELFDGQSIRWTLEAPDNSSGVALASEQRRHIYLIIKEALTNVLRHAQATNLVVLVKASHGRLRVEMTDDGVGLNAKPHNSSNGPGGGHGLENMQRRASALGGSARIESPAHGRGTTIVVDVPLRHPHVHAVGRALSPH